MAEAEYVEILVGTNDMAEIARKLLDAADYPEQVQTISVPSGFRVPQSVAAAAGYSAKEGDVAAVDARAVEGYALGQVTGAMTEGGARGIEEARRINRDAQPEGEAATSESPSGDGGIGDEQVRAEVERTGGPAERVDETPPLTGAETTTENREGGTTTTNEVRSTNLEVPSGGGTGQDPAEASPPGTLTDAPAEGDGPAPGAEAGRRANEITVEEARELKGEALDDALEARGLPRTGSADEKRERLADHVRG